MALDSRGVMDGFSQGFGLMNSYYDNQHRKEMDLENLEMRKEIQGRQRDEWAHTDKVRSQEADDKTMKSVYAELSSTGAINPDMLPDIGRVYNADKHKLAPELRQWYESEILKKSGNEAIDSGGLGLREGTAKNRDAKIKADEVKNKVVTPKKETAFLERLFGGKELSEEDISVLKNAPTGIQIMGTLEMDQALTEVDKQMEIITAGGNVQVTPEFLGTMNTLYANQIGEGKKIVGIYPGQKEGTVVFELEVEGEEGTYKAPMTSGRGTEADEDNEVKQIPVEDIIDSLQSAKALHMEFKANPQAMNSIKKHGQTLGYIPTVDSYKTYADENGNTIRRNTDTGKDELVVAGRNQPTGLAGAKADGKTDGKADETLVKEWSNHRAMLARGMDPMGGLIAPEAAKEQLSQIDESYALAMFGVADPQLIYDMQAVLAQFGENVSTAKAKQIVMDRYYKQQQQQGQQESLANTLGIGALAGNLQPLNSDRYKRNGGVTPRSLGFGGSAAENPTKNAVKPTSGIDPLNEFADSLSRGR